MPNTHEKRGCRLKREGEGYIKVQATTEVKNGRFYRKQ